MALLPDRIMNSSEIWKSEKERVVTTIYKISQLLLIHSNSCPKSCLNFQFSRTHTSSIVVFLNLIEKTSNLACKYHLKCYNTGQKMKMLGIFIVNIYASEKYQSDNYTSPHIYYRSQW